MAVEPDTGEILTPELTTKQEGDASLVSPRLDQIARRIDMVPADGAYGGESVYRSVATHSPGAEVIIPLHSTAVPSDMAGSASNQCDRQRPARPESAGPEGQGRHPDHCWMQADSAPTPSCAPKARLPAPTPAV